MAENTVRLEFNAKEAQEALREALSRSTDLAPLMADIAETLLQGTQERFRTETDPDGNPWAPLDPTYLAMKIEDGLQPGILKATGLMVDTLFQEFGTDFAEVGSGRLQAATHQFGDSERGIPERPFLGASDEDIEDITGAIIDYIDLSRL